MLPVQPHWHSFYLEKAPIFRDYSKDESCDICGDVGIACLLATCSRCKSSCEHLYCMRTFGKAHPESWYCEECEDFIKGSSSNTSGKLQCGSARPNELPNDLRRNSIYCAKKIQTRKVKCLSAGEVIMLKSGSPCTILCKSSSISNSQQVSGNPSSEHSEWMKPPTAWQQVAQLFGGLSGAAVSPNLEIQIADPMNVVPLSTLPLDNNSLCTPAADASWRGSFNVLLSDPKQWEISCSVQGHLACRVRRKVYESTKLMPEVLELELVGRGSLWTSLFKNHCPDRRDIGLYFFPSNSERCNNYMSLLEHMSEQDLMLRKYMDGRELLIFTSKILPMDCQRWNGQYFLWGVFCRTKLATTSIPEEECQDEGNNDEVAEMEIKTRGGEHVGRSDVAVPTMPLLLPSPDIKEETYPDIPPGFETIYRRNNTSSAAITGKGNIP